VPGFIGEEQPWGFQLRFMTSKPDLQNTNANPEFHYVLGDKGYVCQQPNGAWNISLRVLPGFDEEFLTANEPTPARLQKLKEYVAEHAGMTQDLLDDDSYRGFYAGRAFDGLVIKCSCLNPAGWIAIIGDAAHAVQPATGEGINSGLEDASILAAAVQQHPSDPFTAYDTEHRANAHALQKLALKARDLVVPASARDRAVGVMTTIGLGIAKKLHIIEGTKQDFMLGELARTQGVKSYEELEEMEQRQTRGLKKTARGIAKVLRLSKDSPMDLKRQDAETAVEARRWVHEHSGVLFQGGMQTELSVARFQGCLATVPTGKWLMCLPCMDISDHSDLLCVLSP